MPIHCKVWPSDAINQSQLFLMLRLAEAHDPTWRPPEAFAYVPFSPYSERAIARGEDKFKHSKFVHTLDYMRRRITSLWGSLTPAMQHGFYIVMARAGFDYLEDLLHTWEDQAGEIPEAYQDHVYRRLHELEELLDEEYDPELRATEILASLARQVPAETVADVVQPAPQPRRERTHRPLELEESHGTDADSK